MFYNECFCLKWKRNEPNRNEPKSTRNRTETSRTETEPTRIENEPERTEQTQNKNTKTISTFIIKHYGFAISLLKERWNTHFDFQSDCRSIVYRMLDVIFLREWMEPAGHAAGWLDLWWKKPRCSAAWQPAPPLNLPCWKCIPVLLFLAIGRSRLFGSSTPPAGC